MLNKMLVYCWSSVYDAELTLNQHPMNVFLLAGFFFTCRRPCVRDIPHTALQRRHLRACARDSRRFTWAGEQAGRQAARQAARLGSPLQLIMSTTDVKKESKHVFQAWMGLNDLTKRLGSHRV